MRRWHRRVGAAIGLIALLLAITGILLNHSERLGLPRLTISQPWLLAVYGIEPPHAVAFPVNDLWVSHWGGNQLFLQAREVSFCQAPLSGAVFWRDQIVAACADGLVLLTTTGEVIERIGGIYGVPQPITGLAAADHLYLQTPDGVFRADLDAMQWSPVAVNAKPVTPSPLPPALAEPLASQLAGAELTLERVIADIHSGRILGSAGIWLADLAALGLVFLGGSGLWLWWRMARYR